MEPRELSQATSEPKDEREWELADEELDRTVPQLGPICSTSRLCTCSRCHCR